MYQSPTTHNPMQQRLSDLRMEQYAALGAYPIDWDTVGRLGQQILALEIKRQQSETAGRSPTVRNVHAQQ